MNLTLRRGGGSEPLPEQDDNVQRVQTEAPVTVLAAVNLLPRTYAQRAAVRRAKAFAVGAVVFALLLATLAWLVAWQKQTGAQEQLDAATAERSILQTQAARYAEVPLVFAAVADAQKQLELAMGNEVRWSFHLNDLALTMPSGVSLDTLAVTSLAPGESSAEPTGGRTDGAGQNGAPVIGTMNASAKAFTYNSVANWLDSLAKLKTLEDPYVGKIAAATEEGKKVVTYSSTADITPKALSKRYLPKEDQP